MKTMRQLLRCKDFWRVDPKRTKAMPFPGRYPTRWRILFQNGSAETSDTVTKPNAFVFVKVTKVARYYQGHITLYEFDRGGTIRWMFRPAPRVTFTVHQTCPIVCGVYYPWHDTSGDFFLPWFEPVHFKRIETGRRAWNIYSPWKTMVDPASIERLREYKSWLRKVDPWK